MEKTKKSINKKLLIIILAVIVLSLFVPDLSDSDKKSNENVTDSSQKTETFEVGEFGYLTDYCFGFVNYDDLGKVMDIVKADDKRDMQEMVASKKATILAPGKQVKIIKIKIDIAQVRDVDASELLVWVPLSMLTHEDIYGLYEN